MAVCISNVLGDIYDATTVNNSIVDFWKYGMQDKFDKMAGSDQKAELELPGTNIVIRQTPFVTTTPNYKGSGSTAYRSYVFGIYATISGRLEVPGETDLDEEDWRPIYCRVVSDAPPSSFDPTATIGGWCSYKFEDLQDEDRGLLAA